MSEMQQTIPNELFYLKWSNFQVSVSSEFKKIQEAADLVDITFSCDGKQFGAHKLVLFACSPYFKEVLKKNPCSHPVFFINGFKSEVLRALLDFMYMGEVHINNEDLVDFIEMAEQFKIRGVTKEQTQDASVRRADGNNDKMRRKRMRMDNDVGTVDGIIEPKSEISEYGETSTVGGYSTTTNVDYNAQHKVPDNHAYDDAGPSSVASQGDPWLDDKHFLSGSGSGNGTNATANNSTNESQESRCKSKNYKALEPCSCPLCSRVYSNVSNLRQHMRLIHNPTSVCCPLCQKSFTSDLYLKRHYLSMHGSSNIPNMPGSATTTPQGHPQPPQQQQQPQQTPNQPHNPTPPSHSVDKHTQPFIYKRDYADPTANSALDAKQQQPQPLPMSHAWPAYDSKVE